MAFGVPQWGTDSWNSQTIGPQGKNCYWVVATQIFFIFNPNLGRMNPFWLIFFRGVESTNQVRIVRIVWVDPGSFCWRVRTCPENEQWRFGDGHPTFKRRYVLGSKLPWFQYSRGWLMLYRFSHLLWFHFLSFVWPSYNMGGVKGDHSRYKSKGWFTSELDSPNFAS